MRACVSIISVWCISLSLTRLVSRSYIYRGMDQKESILFLKFRQKKINKTYLYMSNIDSQCFLLCCRLFGELLNVATDWNRVCLWLNMYGVSVDVEKIINTKWWVVRWLVEPDTALLGRLLHMIYIFIFKFINQSLVILIVECGNYVFGKFPCCMLFLLH